MAHSPDWPQLFVCEECRLVYAGKEDQTLDEGEFAEPESCSSCGNATLTEIEMVTKG